MKGFVDGEVEDSALGLDVRMCRRGGLCGTWWGRYRQGPWVSRETVETVMLKENKREEE